MLRNIYLHGRLKKKFGFHHELAIDTVGEAIRGLMQHAGFGEEIKKGSYELIRGDRKTGMRIDLDEVNTFNLGHADLHIVPITGGKKGSGGMSTVKIVLGVALMGAAIFFSGGTLAAPLAGMAGTAFMGVTYGNLAVLGLGLALAGVSQLLTPSTETKEAKSQDSFLLGPGNSSTQGTPVPLIYGEVICGSNMISGGMDVEKIAVNWDPLKGDTTPFGGDP